MTDRPKRSWLRRLGLQADEPEPDDWIVLVRGLMKGTPGSNYHAERTVELLTAAGIEAEAKPYVLPDDTVTRGFSDVPGPPAEDRLRIAIVVRQRDHARAEELIQARPAPPPIDDEELARLAEESGPAPPE